MRPSDLMGSSSPMTIAVVIPVFNEERRIAEAVRHTSSLGFDAIVVVDGGSTDQTRELVTTCSITQDVIPLGLPQTPVTLLSTPQGRAGQLNAGAKVCRGEILVFLHADTRLPADARQQIESALADPVIVGGRFDVRFDSHSPWGTVISTFMNLRSRLTGVATGDQAIFVRRHVFERLGGFTDIPLMEDVDFSVRLKRAGRVVPLREAVTTSFRRWERQGPLKTILLMWTLRFLYWIGVSPYRLARLYPTVRD